MKEETPRDVCCKRIPKCENVIIYLFFIEIIILFIKEIDASPKCRKWGKICWERATTFFKGNNGKWWPEKRGGGQHFGSIVEPTQTSKMGK
jgi:hypothetical protein